MKKVSFKLSVAGSRGRIAGRSCELSDGKGHLLPGPFQLSDPSLKFAQELTSYKSIEKPSA